MSAVVVVVCCCLWGNRDGCVVDSVYLWCSYVFMLWRYKCEFNNARNERMNE